MNQDPSRLAAWRDWFRRVFLWLGSLEFSTLVLIALIGAGLWAFAELADEALEEEVGSLDRAVLLAMRNAEDLSDPIGPRWFEDLARDFTGLGGIGVLTFITLAVTGFLFVHRRRDAVIVIAAVAGGCGVSFLLKALLGRARPDLVPHGVVVESASFPSGHAMMSAATYLTLGMLLARSQPGRRVKAYFLILAVLLAVAVGLSRVYLGVHWPTDVLAGWTLGACWAMLCWLIASHWPAEEKLIEP